MSVFFAGRYNLTDMVFMASASAIGAHGAYGYAILLIVIGALISVIGERVIDA